MHMGDGWGGNCTKYETLRMPGIHLKVTRKGRFRHEFLLQQLLFRRTVIGDPVGLNRGKKAWNVFQGACDLFGTLRCQGHTGLSGSIYVSDGLLCQSLSRKFAARHKLYYKIFEEELGDAS